MVRERTHRPFNNKNGARDPQDPPLGLSEAVSDRFKDATEEMQERVGRVADQAMQFAGLAQDAVKQFKPLVQKSLRENPMTTLAGFVLVGFVLGAMWKK
jgi:hypothetical protein